MASDLNCVILIGRLTKDIELRYTSGGTACGKFSLAVNKKRKQGEQWVDEVSFLDIVVWGKSAENLAQYLVKGKQVAVEGELHQNRWEQDGQSRSKIEINANNVQLLGGKDTRENGASQANDSMPPDFPDDPPGF